MDGSRPSSSWDSTLLRQTCPATAMLRSMRIRTPTPPSKPTSTTSWRTETTLWPLASALADSCSSESKRTFSRLAVGGVGANVLARLPAGALADALESGDPRDAVGNPLAEVLVRAGERSGHHQKALVAFLRRPNRRRLSPEELSRIGCPVLAVVGREDAAVQPVERFANLLQEPTVLEIPGADHFGTMSSPMWLGATRDFFCQQGHEAARKGRRSGAVREA
jgi:pimeloyl-ACP methyl ester carboxylesterase